MSNISNDWSKAMNTVLGTVAKRAVNLARNINARTMMTELARTVLVGLAAMPITSKAANISMDVLDSGERPAHIATLDHSERPTNGFHVTSSKPAPSI